MPDRSSSHPAYILAQLRTQHSEGRDRSNFREAIEKLSSLKRRDAWNYVKHLENVIELQEQCLNLQGVELAETKQKLTQMVVSEQLFDARGGS